MLFLCPRVLDCWVNACEAARGITRKLGFESWPITDGAITVATAPGHQSRGPGLCVFPFALFVPAPGLAELLVN
jgi:hypothetical protein